MTQTQPHVKAAACVLSGKMGLLQLSDGQWVDVDVCVVRGEHCIRCSTGTGSTDR